jgi:hypothetical protein
VKNFSRPRRKSKALTRRSSHSKEFLGRRGVSFAPPGLVAASAEFTHELASIRLRSGRAALCRRFAAAVLLILPTSSHSFSETVLR